MSDLNMDDEMDDETTGGSSKSLFSLEIFVERLIGRDIHVIYF